MIDLWTASSQPDCSASQKPGQSNAQRRRQRRRRITESTALAQPAEDDSPSSVDLSSELERETEALMLAIQLQGAQRAEDVLQVAAQALDRLTPESTLTALQLAARLLPGSPEVTADLEQSYRGQSKPLADIVQHLKTALPCIRSPRSVSKLVWALGKFEMLTPDVQVVMAHISRHATPILPKFSPHDLANTLWGVAKLYGGSARGTARVSPKSITLFSFGLVTECSRRIQQLSSQCLVNALWSASRLRLRGGQVDSFLSACLQELRERPLSVFAPQGLANALWAAADLRSAGVGQTIVPPEVLHGACVAVSRAARDRLCEFQPQELSMLAWAVAKLHGRRHGAPDPTRSRRLQAGVCKENSWEADARELLLGIAAESQSRLQQFSAQSVSNIAWALATLNLVRRKSPARDFMLAALRDSLDKLSSYSPQSIANLMWAAVRLEGTSQELALVSEVENFAAAASRDASKRMNEFQWRDLAAVAVALAHGQLRIPEGMAFVIMLAASAAGRCDELTPQMMLNISHSAVRLGVPPELMQPLVDDVAEHVDAQRHSLNNVDLRQWRDVTEWCPPQQKVNMTPSGAVPLQLHTLLDEPCWIRV